MTSAEWDALAADAKAVSMALSTVCWWVSGVLAGASDGRRADQSERMLRVVMDEGAKAQVVAKRLEEVAGKLREAETRKEAKGADTE